MATYDVKLNDEWSSAADDVLSSIREMKAGFTSLAGPVKEVGAALDGAGTRVNAAGRLVDSASGKFTKMRRATDEAGVSASKAGGFFDALKGNLIGSMTVAGLAGDAIKAVGRALLEMGKAAVVSIAKAVAFGENLAFSLTRFMGGADIATAAIAELAELANKLGLDFQQAGSEFRAFISAGATKEAAMALLAFKADILAVGDGSDATKQRVTEAFKQIEKSMATGKIELDAYTSILSNLPVTQLQVMEKLAPKIGLKVSDLVDEYGKLKVEMTKLPVKELLEAFQEATLSATGFGAAGEAAIAKQLSTMSGAFDFIAARAGNLPDALAASVIPKIQGKLLPLMQRLSEAFDSPIANKAMEAIAQGISDIVVAIADAITSVMDFASGFADGMASAEAVIGPVREALGGTAEDADSLGVSMEDLGHAFGVFAAIAIATADALEFIYDVIVFIFSPVGLLIDALTWLGKALYDAFTTAPDVGGFFSSLGDSISEAASSIWASASGVGSAIVDGILSVLSPDALFGAISSMVGGAVEFAKQILGISSPSKVFADIGKNMGAGLVVGVDAANDNAHRAVRDLVDVPIPTAASGPTAGLQAPQSQQTSGGAAAARDGMVVNINIDTAGAYGAAATSKDPPAFAGAVQNMIRESLADELERVLDMVG
jgi:hypothetical protein